MIKRVAACATALVLLVAPGAWAGIAGVGITAFGGWNMPLAQDDAKAGYVVGLRAPVQMISMLRLEPWLSKASNGDYTFSSAISGTKDFDGGEITSYGLNALLGTPMTGPGMSFAIVGGIGSHKFEVQGLGSDSRVGYNLGLDLGIGLGSLPLTLSARGEVIMIPQEGGGSRNNAFVTGGLTYKFGL